MKKTQQNFVEQPNLLAINHFWQKLFTPLYPILADQCQTSILSVKHATEPMFDIIAYQLLKKTTPSQTKTFQPFSSFLKDDKLSNFDIETATNFKNIPQLKINKTKIFEQFFPKQQHPMLIGYLLAKTSLTTTQLQTLLAWTTFLSLKLLHDVCSAKRPNALSEKQLSEWRNYQIFALASTDTASILQIIDFKTDFGILQSWQHTYHLNTQAHIQAILQNLQDFIAPHPLNKNSNTLSENFTKPIINTASSLNENTNTITDDEDIFRPVAPKKLSWLGYLQKYWVATSIVLSGVVFGTMNFIMPDKTDKKTAQTTAVKASQNNPNSQARYNDVAIVKVASTVENTETKPTDNPVTKLTNNPPTKTETEKVAKTDKIEKSAKTEQKPKENDNKKSESKNSDKKPTNTKTTEKSKQADERKTDNKDTKKSTDKKAVEKKSDTNKNSKTDNGKKSEKSDKKPNTKTDNKTEKPTKDDKTRKKTDEKSTKTEKKVEKNTNKQAVEKSNEKPKTTKPAEPKKAPPKVEPASPAPSVVVEDNAEN